MKKLILILCVLVGTMYAQDSLYVKIYHLNVENYIYVADTTLLDEYLDENFDTTHVDFYVERVVDKDANDDVQFDTFQLKMLKGKYRHKIWKLKTSYYKKLKKIKRQKFKEYKKSKP